MASSNSSQRSTVTPYQPPMRPRVRLRTLLPESGRWRRDAADWVEQDQSVFRQE
jgi:hypothetical protein